MKEFMDCTCVHNKIDQWTEKLSSINLSQRVTDTAKSLHRRETLLGFQRQSDVPDDTDVPTAKSMRLVRHGLESRDVA